MALGLNLDALGTVLAFVLGVVLGAFHAVGQRITIRRMARSSRPKLLFAVSMVVRMAVVATVLIVFARNDWKRIVVCLLGFLLVRAVLTRYWGTDHSAL